MSDTSLHSCGRINCELAEAFPKKPPKSFCGLLACNEDAFEKKTLPHKKEYCKYSKCNQYLENQLKVEKDKKSTEKASKTSSRQSTTSINLIDEADSKKNIFNFPECDITDCPKKETDLTVSKGSTSVNGDKKRIQICGPPECCNTSSKVEFGGACDLQSKRCTSLKEPNSSLGSARNKIIYCVSPSVYNDLEIVNGFNLAPNYVKAETILENRQRQEYCPQTKCCKEDITKKNKDIKNISGDEKLVYQDKKLEDAGHENELVTSFYSFNSNHDVVSNKKYIESENPVQESKILTGRVDTKIDSNAVDLLRKFGHGDLITSADSPATPMPSSTEFVDQTPFGHFPSSPYQVDSKNEEIVRQYLTEIDDFPDLSKDFIQPEFPHLTHKNQPELNALLKAVYLTTSDDFPPSPLRSNRSSRQDLQLTMNDNNDNMTDNCCLRNYHELKTPEEAEQNIISNDLRVLKESCEIDHTSTYIFQDEPDMPDPSANTSKYLDNIENSRKARTTKKTCNQNTCTLWKTPVSKKWKNCCNAIKCPINDPTTSTYNFLLKVKLCCKKRGCQLAAKICDIYEPLVKIDTEFDDVGEAQYHYLASDASTEADSDETWEESISKHLNDNISVEKEHTIDEFPLTEEYAKHKEEKAEEDELSSYSAILGADTANQKRASTVSWSTPPHDPHPSTSQELLISKATAEANRFRQTPEAHRHSALFEEIVRRSIDDTDEMSKTKTESDIFYKSKLDTVDMNDSWHKHKCCPLLRSKFKKSKKKHEEYDGPSTNWQTYQEHEKKRKSNLGNTPVQEKNEQINNMLNKM